MIIKKEKGKKKVKKKEKKIGTTNFKVPQTIFFWRGEEEERNGGFFKMN